MTIAIRRNELSTNEPIRGRRLHSVIDLPVEVTGDLPWEQAVLLGAPDTETDDSIWKVGDLYPGTKGGQKTVVLSLCYLGPDISGPSWMIEEGLQFASDRNLTLAGPREVLAVGKQYPDLHKQLEVEIMYLLALYPFQMHMALHIPQLRFCESRRSLSSCGADRRVNYYFPAWFVAIGKVDLF
jgi:hypothetical protein